MSYSAEAGATPPRHQVKVAILIGSLEVGGAEQDIVRNVPRLDRNEFEVVVFEFNHEGPLGALLAEQGIRVFSRRSAMRYAARPRPGRLREIGERIASLIWVVARLRSERPDITHSFLPEAYVYQMTGKAIARTRERTVMSRLSLNFYRRSQRAISWLERRVLHKRVRAAIGNATVIAEELAAEGVPWDRIHVIHNGIDLAGFARTDASRQRAREAFGISQGDFVLLAVGNLHAYKGHADLIEACALARDELPIGWRLVIAGRDEDGNRAVYERLVTEMGLAGRVDFLGPVSDVPLLLNAADLLVHPSHHEGLPNAVIEAMAASLPVVATAVGGIPEAVAPILSGDGVEHGTGWLVPPESPQALSAALIEATGDAERGARAGERAGVRARTEFSLERSVVQLGDLYHELMR